MPHTLTDADLAKRAAAEAALEFVEPGMRLGLGTGSTAEWMVRGLGARLREGGLRGLRATPTSLSIGGLAEREGVPLITLDEAGWLDLTIDGADEIDPGLALIKGGGGALLQEKIVACASDRMIVIADATKRVDRLGAFPLPVEIVPFGWETTKAIVETLLEDAAVGARGATLRLARDEPFITDGGHMILDLRLRRIDEPAALHAELIAIPGVIDTGLFIDIAERALLGRADGRVETMLRESG